MAVPIAEDRAASRLVYGCMRIGDAGEAKGIAALEAALDAGYTRFDHADIYGAGDCEALFGRFLRDNPGVRDDLTIIGKCGIRPAGDPDADSPKRYDFSAAHIVGSVDASLSRLGVDQLDALLLHRPDYLMNADEVAQAFDELEQSGRVRQFGVSNFIPPQVDLLQSRLTEPLRFHQVEINLRNPSALVDGTLDQCQQRGMVPQAWSPLAGVVHPGWGDPLTAETEQRVRAELERQAAAYSTDGWIVALAWLMLHPAGISPVIGSTSPSRIRQAVGAADVDYQRDDWYRLLEARVGQPVL